MRNRQHFARQFGRGAPTFKCQVCERMTRDTGQGVDHLCEQCYEIAGWDNTVNDNGYQPGSPDFAKYRAICETELAKAVKLGSNGDLIKRANSYIWCLKSDFEAVEPATPALPTAVRFKVKIVEGDVLQDGNVIAHMGRGPMVYVTAADEARSFIARFKYARPSSKARAFIKTVFARMTIAEYLALYGEQVSPADIEARCEGYESSLDRYRKTRVA